MFIDCLDIDDSAELEFIAKKFEVGVKELYLIITEQKRILHCPTSQGKDSTVVELMAIEAYRRAIADKKIESSRPLILSTVNTLSETIAMNMYVFYAKKRLIDYAKKCGINILYNIVTPPINDEYFIRYVGGQKLPVNVSRRGDCSIILKVDPSEKYLNNMYDKYGRKEMIVTCVGSRNSESVRRHNNMKNQQLSNKSVTELLAEIETDTLNKRTIYKYAPIKDWSTEEVFDALRIAGDKPIKKVRNIRIPAFLNDFGLLLEIYGNGSNEVCEISVGSKNTSSCNGSARFGCSICTMVGEVDKSSTSLAELPRWKVLGVENALRLRDYLYRLSCDIDARALHARAYDPVGYNRVALQPNVLKPKHLDKIVRYASQITLDSIRIAKEFKELVRQGREDEHEGYRCILEDQNIPPKTKRAFLEMYKECAQDPKNLNYFFSEKHALLLSFRWAIDGIGAAPYRPLAIWDQLSRNQGWIPYPKLNSEIDMKVSINDASELPEAVMMPILKEEDPKQHAINPTPLMSLWSRPTTMMDIHERDMNCSARTISTNSVSCSAKYNQPINVIDIQGADGSHPLDVPVITDGLVSHKRLTIPNIESDHVTLTINSKTINAYTRSVLFDRGIKEELKEALLNKAMALVNVIINQGGASEEELSQLLKTHFNKEIDVKLSIPFMENKALNTGYSDKQRKTSKLYQFTKRVTKVKRGKFYRKNTRLAFYPYKLDSSLHNAFKQEVNFLEPNFGYESSLEFGLHDDGELLNNEHDVQENLFVCEQGYQRWLFTDGRENALRRHNEYYENLISKRHLRKISKRSVRMYAGSDVANDLLNHGVISIHKRYWRVMNQILKRTHIFNELGLFEFQSLPTSEVQKHPRAINMSKHREDKALVVSEIRKYRNEQRRAVKQKSSLTSLQLLKSNITDFGKVARDAINTVINKRYASNLKTLFETDEISISQQVSVYDLWLTIYFDGKVGADEFLKNLLTQQTFKSIKDEPAEYLQATKMIIDELSELSHYIDESTQMWAPMLESLNRLKNENDETMLESYKSIIKKMTPDAFADYSIEYWNPSYKTLSVFLEKQLNTVAGNADRLKKIQNNIQGMKTRSLSKVTSQLSLSEKLALLNKQAA